MHSRRRTTKHCCRGTVHRKRHSKRWPHLAVGGVHGSLTKVYLLEASERILPALPERISQAVHRELVKLGVEVLVRTAVQEVTPCEVVLRDNERVKVDLTIWAAGIKAPAFLGRLDGLTTNRINQLEVLPTLQSVSDESVFAIGDCAACPVEGSDGKRVPPRAQAAHQQAELLAQNLERQLSGKPLKSFKYRDYGTLVSLASFSAVGTLMGNLSGATFVEGLLARMFYMSLYRMHQAAASELVAGSALSDTGAFGTDRHGSNFGVQIEYWWK